MTAPTALVIAHDLLARKRLRQHLERAGFTTAEAHDAAESQRSLEACRADLIVLDAGLPDVASVLADDRVGGTSSYILLVVISDDEPALDPALRSAADDILAMPFEPSELGARLRLGLRILRLEQSLAEHERRLGEASAQVDEIRDDLGGLDDLFSRDESSSDRRASA